MKKKYEELDLIEKHRVLLWYRIKNRLQHHLQNISSRLEPYDISSLPEKDINAQTGGPSLKELDTFFEKMNQSVS